MNPKKKTKCRLIYNPGYNHIMHIMCAICQNWAKFNAKIRQTTIVSTVYVCRMSTSPGLKQMLINPWATWTETLKIGEGKANWDQNTTLTKHKFWSFSTRNYLVRYREIIPLITHFWRLKKNFPYRYSPYCLKSLFKSEKEKLKMRGETDGQQRWWWNQRHSLWWQKCR